MVLQLNQSILVKNVGDVRNVGDSFFCLSIDIYSLQPHGCSVLWSPGNSCPFV